MIKIKIGKKIISKFSRPYFIADIGANHDGDIYRAFKLIELAKESGADAVKFQNFKADKIVSKFGFENLRNKSTHQSKWKKSVYEIYKDASIKDSWNKKIKEKCDEFDIEYCTSPYDFESVDKVNKLVNVFKIGSGDITWHEIIEYISKKKKPVIIATGASNLNQVKMAIEILNKNTKEIILLQCNTNYTASKNNFKFINLNVLKTYAKIFPNYILGLSDHTLGHSTILGAISLGATVFEKHFSDDNSRIGPDHKFAMNSDSWKKMIQASLELYDSLGDGIKRIETNEIQSRIVQQRSLRVKRNLSRGQIIKSKDIEALRPCPRDSIMPFQINKILGKKLKRDKKKGQHLVLKDFVI